MHSARTAGVKKEPCENPATDVAGPSVACLPAENGLEAWAELKGTRAADRVSAQTRKSGLCGRGLGSLVRKTH